MSLLSSTQGTPDRVLSLLQVLAAHDGQMDRADLLAWLNPPFTQTTSGAVIGPAAEQTLGAASSLNFIRQEDGRCWINDGLEFSSLDDLADLTHQRLLSLDLDHADAVLPQAFAYIVARSEQAKGTAWLHTATNKALADAINQALPTRSNTAAEGRRFNEYKFAPFWRWMTLIGLALDLPGDGPHPYVLSRLARELAQSDLPRGEQIPVRLFLDVIAKRMPYLDGGVLYNSAAEKLGLPAQGRALSPILSTALRDLHEEGTLALGSLTDAASLVHLADDRFSRIKAVQFVTLPTEGANG
ncbi:hypothetical protein ABIE71_002239 [Bradyrhizobium diazoefficiens]